MQTEGCDSFHTVGNLIFLYIFKSLGFLESQEHFLWFSDKWGNGLVSDIQPTVEGTYLLSRLGNTRFPCSLTAVDMVSKQLAITSPSHAVSHSCSLRIWLQTLRSGLPLTHTSSPPMYCMHQPIWTPCHFAHCLFPLFSLPSISTLIS